jgi:hypothetical protein
VIKEPCLPSVAEHGDPHAVWGEAELGSEGSLGAENLYRKTKTL